MSASAMDGIVDLPTPAPVPQFSRIPVVGPDGLIFGYCLTASYKLAPTRLERDAALNLAYRDLNLASLTYDRPVLLGPTAELIAGTAEPPSYRGTLILTLYPEHLADPELALRIVELRRKNVRAALFEYQGSPAQEALLHLVDYVMIDYGHAEIMPHHLADAAREAGARVIAENVQITCSSQFPAGADLAMSSIFGAPERTSLNPSELQCLEAVRLLGEDDVDTQRIAEVLSTDPAMVVRILRLVNSSAEGLSHRIDSLQQAIVLLGATRVSGLVMASLVSSTARSMDNLWLMLARAATCREIAGNESAYTLGLLSALSWEAGIPFRVLVEQTRISPELAQALMLGSGPLGRVLTAVVAHEQNDADTLFLTGIDPERVALASLVAIPWALSTVLTAVSASPVRERPGPERPAQGS